MKQNALIIFIMFIISALNAQTPTATNPAASKVSANQSNNSYEPLQKFNGDTLRYVQQNFIDNKHKYVGKDLNTLLNDLEIPIKSFFGSLDKNNYDNSPAIFLQFYTFRQASMRKTSPNKPVNIIVHWSQPLPYDHVLDLFKQNYGDWTDAARQYFGKQIIGDILTTDWKE